MVHTAGKSEQKEVEVLEPLSGDRIALATERLKQYRFKAGQSGNPGGKSKLELEVRRMAREWSPEVMAKMIDICLTTDDERVAVVAGEKILERAYGKARELQPGEGEDPALAAKVSRLTADERDALKALLLKAVGKDEAPVAPESSAEDDP